MACADVTKEVDAESDEAAISATPATRLGELAYGSLLKPRGAFTGAPIWVSNNPEDVGGRGLLSSTRPPAPAVAPRGSGRGTPYPDLTSDDESALLASQPGCPRGEVRALDVYLAHILSSTRISGNRRLSVIAEAGTRPSVLRWGALLGTTSWSDEHGLKTTRPDWLSAKVADFRLSQAEGSRALTSSASLAPGQLATLATVTADSLVEGALHLEAEGGCVAVHVVAHAADGDELLPTYASGDIVRPGWKDGQGYGRAAGMYQGSRWRGTAEGSITRVRSALGWRLFDAEQSPKALVRHGDSASVLFGGYGVVYEARVTLVNRTDQCVSAQFAFTSYANLAPTPGAAALGERRTPSVASLGATDASKRPSMMWNGPVWFRQELRGGRVAEGREHVILKPSLRPGEERDRLGVPADVSRALFRWDMNAGESRKAVVRIPVPGYVVAPAALTVESTPCGR
jgi:hypothetical protein